MFTHDLIDKVFTVAVESASLKDVNIYNCFEKVSNFFIANRLPFDCGADYSEFIDNKVGTEKTNKDGKWTKRFKKCVEVWAKERGLKNPTKLPEWEVFFQELVRQYKLQESEKTFIITFKQGLENLVDAVKINSSSCYMREWASSIDSLVENKGIVMETCDEKGRLDYQCRAWIIPQFNSKDEIVSAGLFNGYYWNDNDPTRVAALVFGKIVGVNGILEGVSCDNIYVNNEVMYGFNIKKDFDPSNIEEVSDGEHNYNCNGKECDACNEMFLDNHDDYNLCLYCRDCMTYCEQCEEYVYKNNYNYNQRCCDYCAELNAEQEEEEYEQED